MEQFTKIAVLSGLPGVIQTGLLLTLLAILVLRGLVQLLDAALKLRNDWVLRPGTDTELRPCSDPGDPPETLAIGSETVRDGP